MSRSQFPLFQSHLDMAQAFWKQHLHPGDIAIDATMGNGYDTLHIARLLFPSPSSHLYAIDVDPQAIDETKKRLTEAGIQEHNTGQVELHLMCHSHIDSLGSLEGKASLIVYNLGYRPKAQTKEKTTMTETTLISIQKSLSLLRPGGVISLTCYPGHDEGKRETEAIDHLFGSSLLPAQEWSITRHSWMNRSSAPVLYLIQRSSHLHLHPHVYMEDVSALR